MLSGEFPPTSGTAHIAGFSVTREQAQLRQRIGYCPQFSALIDALTVREHLELFARIKGVPEPRVPGRVRAKMGEMDLLDFADKAAGSLSGGNQRKLSVAIATISDPPVLFLDGACVVRVGHVMLCCAVISPLTDAAPPRHRLHPSIEPPPPHRAFHRDGPSLAPLHVGRHRASSRPRQLHHPHHAQHVCVWDG